ncbi:hypothetical protein GC105_00175 [Alkalibaculum sp. M08DMB]|uniref:Uroporphyrinogen decarboxylase (URO-D) domain-containing protein n=1 Tax=Alkalibaculum sporogenes TaxID=2655001 RepID=A0A6A7K4G6_9FIRM|nr:hypothetical protein [Alkalibaculum sporogenes]MPW24214.1 hypothetical protein [Alkalibaculum sporogenes]
MDDKLSVNKQNLKDALSFKEPDKVPVGIEVAMWPYTYSNTRYDQVRDNPKVATETYVKFLDDISIDYMWGPTGVTKPIDAFLSLGSDSFLMGSDGNSIVHAQTNEIPMEEWEYEDFIKDPRYYWREVLLRKRIPAFQHDYEKAYQSFLEALVAYRPVYETNKRISAELTQRGIYPLSSNGPHYSVPLDTFFDQVRGMKNTLLDLRRRPEVVKRACDRIFEIDMQKMKEKPSDYIGKDDLFCGITVYHSACFLNAKQFDEMFMYYLKKGFMEFFEAGVHMFVKGEGKFIHTLNRFRELPRGAMVIMLEEDDPFECYKEIGDWATLATGISADLLKYGTKQQCIDYVKKCFDTFAPGGGFIFMQDRPLMGVKDANIDNLIAVYEFANEYGKK